MLSSSKAQNFTSPTTVDLPYILYYHILFSHTHIRHRLSTAKSIKKTQGKIGVILTRWSEQKGPPYLVSPIDFSSNRFVTYWFTKFYIFIVVIY